VENFKKRTSNVLRCAGGLVNSSLKKCGFLSHHQSWLTVLT
jgi:hypothetical protein